jgi:hypothetical protein
LNQSPSIRRIEWTDARDVLAHEAIDFTPWLAENLDLLAEPLGLIDVELVQREWRVDTFSLDILAKASDAEGDVQVVIENQYGRTDHDHLGKLITYAAHAAREGDRVLAVWIVEDVRPAHLAAVEFLNRISSSGAQLGLVLMRLRFTPSPDGYFVHFESEAEPNEFLREASSPTSGVGTLETQQSRGEFIHLVADRLERILPRTVKRAGGVNARHGAVVYRFSDGNPLAKLATIRVLTKGDRAYVALYVDRLPTAKGNTEVTEAIRLNYENRLSSYNLRVDKWHGSDAQTKRDRVLTYLNAGGFLNGDAVAVADEAATLICGWIDLAEAHPIESLRRRR